MTSTGDSRQWTVRGVVQRVGFRMFIVREAKRLGLRGTVRNTSEGAVEVIAAGPVGALDQLFEKLRRGPEGAVVESIEQVSHEGIPDELPNMFTVIP